MIVAAHAQRHRGERLSEAEKDELYAWLEQKDEAQVAPRVYRRYELADGGGVAVLD